MKAAAIIQARMGSSRLPGKSLMEVGGRPMLGLVIERLRRSAKLEDIVVATSGEDEDDAIAALCMDMDAAVARGSKSDVLGRFAAACALTDADVIVRVTADCPFIDAGLIDAALSAWAPGIDRLSAGNDSGYPLGVNAEIVSRAALLTAAAEATESFEREHVTPFLYTRPERFRLETLPAPEALRRPHYRLCVDEPADLAMVRALAARLDDPVAAELAQIIAVLDAAPEIAAMNAGVVQKGFRETEAPR